MTRVTFGVSASSFAANMCIKQNAQDLALEYPQAAKAVEDCFYVDDCLTGADTLQDAIELRRQLQELFIQGDFILHKWHSSKLNVLKDLPDDIKDPHSMLISLDTDTYTKTLCIEWNATSDHFRLTVTDLPHLHNLTKRALVSDIAKMFDVLGWFSPSIVKAKILLQCCWEQKLNWDDPLPSAIQDAWYNWHYELHLLAEKHIPRCYFDKSSQIASLKLRGFCDASELAYAA